MTQTAPSHCQPTVPEFRYRLGALLEGITPQAELPGALADTSITGLALNSRHIRHGNAFVAMPGSVVDGREYVNAAFDSGACAVLFEQDHAPSACRTLASEGRAVGIQNLRDSLGLMASRLYQDPSKYLRVTGITGTNGKTTCAWLLSQALEKLGERCVMTGTIGSGAPGTLIESSLTTQDAVSTQKNLRVWLDKGFTSVCMEVSSHGLDQGRVNGVRFQTAVFTNLTRDHLDYHGDMHTYAQTKKKLFRMPGLGAVVTNTDEALGREIQTLTDAPVQLTYGLAKADVTALKPNFSSTGTQLQWRWRKDRFCCHSKLIGEVNLPNLLAVIATLLAQGHAARQISDLISELRPPPGRMELIPGGNHCPAVIVDYAHTPDALTKALQSLRPLTAGCLTVVFGCGGDRDSGKRWLMGVAAARYADRIMITSDNPRNEDPLVIADMIREGVIEAGADQSCLIELDRAKAIAKAIHHADVNDVILIAGKGHETTQTIGIHRLPFRDQEVALNVMGGTP